METKQQSLNWTDRQPDTFTPTDTQRDGQMYETAGNKPQRKETGREVKIKMSIRDKIKGMIE